MRKAALMSGWVKDTAKLVLVIAVTLTLLGGRGGPIVHSAALLLPTVATVYTANQNVSLACMPRYVHSSVLSSWVNMVPNGDDTLNPSRPPPPKSDGTSQASCVQLVGTMCSDNDKLVGGRGWPSGCLD